MHDQLLTQARRLARLDPTRPRQANLRRAVSAAYYGLFHFLVDQSCRLVMGSQHAESAYRQVLARAFVHTTIRSACKAFSGGTLTTVDQGIVRFKQLPMASEKKFFLACLWAWNTLSKR